MLAFGIRYLHGVVAATEPDSHERVEWPPHPGRVFMALAAAHFQTGADPGEREALTWLEALGEGPAIRAGGHAKRSLVTQYVPVNDKAGDSTKPPTAPIQSAPQLARDRQPRTFARAFLEDDVVYMTWPTAQLSPPVRRALESLCAKVTRIGHSTSLVQMWLAADDEIGEPNWVPGDQRATLHLRVAAPGALAELERLYNGRAVEAYADLLVAAADGSDKTAQRAAKKRLKDEFGGEPPPQQRPRLSVYQGYAPATAGRDTPAAPGTVFSPHPVVLTLERDDGVQLYLDLACVPAVVQRWREAILSQSNDLAALIRALLSGHSEDGRPLEGPHLAFLPLAFVGHPHADGRLLGMGLVLPADVSRDDRREALRAIGRVRHLALGRLGRWAIVPERRSSPPWNLRPEVWTAYPEGAAQWATVTPVVFDRHPKSENRWEYQREVAAMIATACRRVGLPEPREVIVTQVSAHLGVPPAFVLPRLRRKDGSERRHAHAIVVFDEPVCGPIVIGAGRYRGYGVCRPIREESDTGRALP
jgi:CRISPR-associated protein Csb2